MCKLHTPLSSSQGKSCYIAFPIVLSSFSMRCSGSREQIHILGPMVAMVEGMVNIVFKRLSDLDTLY